MRPSSQESACSRARSSRHYGHCPEGSLQMLPVLILILILILIVIPIHEDWGCALELPRWARKDGEERMELVYWTRQVGREGPGLPRAPIGSAPPYAVKSPTPQPPPRTFLLLGVRRGLVSTCCRLSSSPLKVRREPPPLGDALGREMGWQRGTGRCGAIPTGRLLSSPLKMAGEMFLRRVLAKKPRIGCLSCPPICMLLRFPGCLLWRDGSYPHIRFSCHLEMKSQGWVVK